MTHPLKAKIISIIPARAGSKGLPDKNILPLAGHPLIAYSIKASQETSSISRTLVSTDSERIARIARKYGAEVPFIRPGEYALDHSTDLEVFIHALHWLQETENYSPDIIVHLRPTSPVRRLSDIENGIQLLLASNADSLRSITPAPITPYKMWRISPTGNHLTPLLTLEGIPEPYNQPRQDLPEVFWQTGTLDIIRPSTTIGKRSMSGQKIIPYMIPSELVLDIDSKKDFDRAQDLIQHRDCVKFNDNDWS